MCVCVCVCVCVCECVCVCGYALFILSSMQNTYINKKSLLYTHMHTPILFHSYTRFCL